MRSKRIDLFPVILLILSLFSLILFIVNPTQDSLFEFLINSWWLLLILLIIILGSLKTLFDKFNIILKKCEHGVIGGETRQKCHFCRIEKQEQVILLNQLEKLDKEKKKFVEKNNSFKEKIKNEILNHLTTEINFYRKMDPFVFEEKVAELFAKRGFTVSVTSKTNDEGKDIVIKKNGQIKYVECKRFNEQTKVSRPVVQKLFGVITADGVNEGIIVTTSEFTQEAIDFSNKMNGRIQLIDGTMLISLLKETFGNTGLKQSHYQYCSYNLEVGGTHRYGSNSKTLQQELDDYKKSCGELLLVPFNQKEILCKNNHNNSSFANRIYNELLTDPNSLKTKFCPKCGSKLTKKKQRNSSKKFWGCSNYPSCRHTQSIKY